MDVGDGRLDRVAGRDDIVDDQDFLALRGCVVRRKRAAFPVAFLAGPVDDQLPLQFLAHERRERDSVDRDAHDGVRIHLALLEFLERNVRHRRGHEADAVPEDADGPPADLHVLRRLAAFHAAGQ